MEMDGQRLTNRNMLSLIITINQLIQDAFVFRVLYQEITLQDRDISGEVSTVTMSIGQILDGIRSAFASNIKDVEPKQGDTKE